MTTRFLPTVDDLVVGDEVVAVGGRALGSPVRLASRSRSGDLVVLTFSDASVLTVAREEDVDLLPPF